MVLQDPHVLCSLRKRHRFHRSLGSNKGSKNWQTCLDLPHGMIPSFPQPPSFQWTRKLWVYLSMSPKYHINQNKFSNKSIRNLLSSSSIAKSKFTSTSNIRSIFQVSTTIIECRQKPFIVKVESFLRDFKLMSHFT